MCKLSFRPNRYRLRPDFSIERYPQYNLRPGGAWVNNAAKWILMTGLTDDICLYIAFSDSAEGWNDFDFVEVLDESFGQPYTPFYDHFDDGVDADSDFKVLKTVIQRYNEEMNKLDFLEKVPMEAEVTIQEPPKPVERNKIADFIAHFHGSEEVFLHGCCYWFADILWQRFHDEAYSCCIVYEPIEGHFLAEIRNSFYDKARYYDIRGDVTQEYSKPEHPIYPIGQIQTVDPKHFKRLMRDCRDFLPPEED